MEKIEQKSGSLKPFNGTNIPNKFSDDVKMLHNLNFHQRDMDEKQKMEQKIDILEKKQKRLWKEIGVIKSEKQDLKKIVSKTKMGI